MSTLNSRIREHVDALAAPIELDEAMRRSSPASTPQRRPRWPMTAAAGVLLAVGLAMTATLIADRGTAPSDITQLDTVSPATAPVTASMTTVSGEPVLQLTVEAGTTVAEIGELVASTTGIDADDFARAARQAARRTDPTTGEVDAAEGLLAPGVYRLEADATADEIADEMVTRMDELMGEADIVASGAVLGRSPYEILTIASLIEAEARAPQDRARISRVIHNRLFVTDNDPSSPFPLQLDSSVSYGRVQTGIDDDVAFAELRQIPTDWNTYVIPELPPTPIATPSPESIEAALEPASNPRPADPICRDLAEPDQCFLFFFAIAEADGSMAFAATAEQHEANVERAREFGLL